MSPSSAGSGSSGSFSVFSGIVEEAAGVGDRRSGDTTVVGVQTLFDVFLNMPLKSAYFIDEAFFFGKKQTF
jgi:hypothetical protein